MATKERELHLTYNDSLAEMKGLLSAQKRVGAQWKGEMEILTKRFQVNNWLYFLQNIFVIKYLLGLDEGCLVEARQMQEKVRKMQGESREMKTELETLRGKCKEKEEELEESRELCGIYSAKLTKMERKFKKLKDEDEESYMEQTF